MSQPTPPRKSPYQTELEPGTYYWCACGRSDTQPFCDGSHKGSSFSPVKFEVTEKRSGWLCGCKHTQDAPFCDGNHKKL